MTNTTVRRTTLSIAAVAALTGVAACGSGGSGDGGGAAHVSPVAALRMADASTAKADSARVRTTLSMGTLMSMKTDGVLGWSDGMTGTLTITYTGGRAAETMRKLGTATMQARYLSDGYYTRMSEQYANLAGGKHWLRYSYDDIAELGGGSGAYLKDQVQNSTPNQGVRMLLASGDVKRAGEEQVSGQHTTHYTGTVRIADFADKANHDLSAAQLSSLKKQLSQQGITTETVDIWINDQNLLVKKVEKADTANGPMTNTTYFRDYGAKVSVTAPPANDTQDFTKLLKELGAAKGAAAGGAGTGS
ncbi:hypothetical protein ACF061_08325 [Streptomyces sp. NPDC015220]|uniref:hypothetical protein n=1 Tax=Streptomyces sp. NPDC015220 TaxID=3364947 RepID=UPI0037003937